MQVFKISSQSDFNKLCADIRPHKVGQKIMSGKSKIHFFYIKDISSAAANILKQDALRVGAELITKESVILGDKEPSKALLMATKEQISKLIIKEKKQDFKLKDLAKFLEKDFAKPEKVKIMGVLNLNNDSFNKQSRVDETDFEKRLLAMLDEGADYIDIGAVSSRPGSRYCGKEEEFKRLNFALDLIYKKNYYERAIFSLDSFDEYCLEYALNKGFKLINDIQGLRNEKLAILAKKYSATYCLMHMQNDPHNMQDKPEYDFILADIESFFKEKLELLSSFGVGEILLDVGIGFGKSPRHNMLLIKHLEHFLHFQKPLLVGASRKSVINAYYKSEVDERLAGSLFLHLKAYENGASIIRTHDVKEHKQLFAMAKAMKELAIK